MKIIRPILAAAILAGSAAGLWRWLARRRDQAFPLPGNPPLEDDDGADLSCASELFPAQRRRDLPHLRCHLAPLLLLAVQDHATGLVLCVFAWGIFFGWVLGLITSHLRALRRASWLSKLRADVKIVAALVGSARTTLSVEDYGDCLAGAQARLAGLLNEIDTQINRS